MPIAGKQEKFDKRFLEDKAAGGAPAVDAVGGGKAINSGLGRNRPPVAARVEGEEAREDESSFGGESLGIRPRKLSRRFSGEVGCEESGYGRRGGGDSPQRLGEVRGNG